MRTLSTYATLLEAGGEIVTASAPQARALRNWIGAERAARGAAVWPTPQILPLSAWLERAAARLDDRPALISRYAATRLWQQIVTDSAAGRGLINARAAAADAERAWQLCADWRIDPASIDPVTAEHAAFRGWLHDYHSRVRAPATIDRAELPRLLVARAAEVFAPDGAAAAAIGFHGFASLEPWRAALVDALRSHGRAPSELTLEAGPATLRRAESASPESELEFAADWLAARLAVEPGARLGLIVPDLATRAAAVARLLDDRLAPQLKAPGAIDARPYSLAAGRRLADDALVDGAFGVLALDAPTLDVLAFGRLLRSPYLDLAKRGSDGAAGALGARLDAALRELGARELPAAELLRRCRAGPDGAATIAASLEAVRRELAGPQRRSAAVWADAWPRALRAAGWPGPRARGARENETAHALYEAFASFAALGRVLPMLSAGEAHAELGALLAAIRFEVDSGEPALVVLDRHEDPGVPFDALWVAGLSADRFPVAAAPNPFLPLALQRAHGMPGATPEAALNAARAALAGWQRAAPSLVLSSARLDGELRLLRAGLLPTAAELDPPAKAEPRAEQVRQAARLERWHESSLPPLAPGIVVEGGVRSLELVSECAFKSAVYGRLDARPLERLVSGVPRRVRGQLMHAALAHFWGELGSHAALAALGAPGLAEAATRAVRAALLGFRHFLPRGRVLELERDWLERALIALAGVERERAPFTVVAREQSEALALGGYRLNLRLDRLDRLEDGSSIVIDYKSGKGTPKRWSGERPDMLQLALYAAFRPEAPAAVAIARLPLAIPKQDKFVGVAARAGLLPGVPAIEHARQRDVRGREWSSLLDEWRRVATELMRAYGAGSAAVDPADGACEHCDLQILCRIQERSLEHEGGADEDSDDGGVTP